MRTLDLLGADAYDADGQHVGTVHDLRLESGARPTRDSGEPAYAMGSLVIGPAGFAHRLGYGRAQMAGPWPLTLIFRRMAARSFVVAWADLERVEHRKVTLRSGADRRPAVEES
ncbi:PRC-barrel domain containing protein [Calidifontibacter sp. DB0510]|uniref:PRC-barrel domain containing protein n=1 Tax=Metallococcus carri TaxID=1656884 RepID=A0A967E9A1_9MICO|nr:PRC-barrel domain-containing protein [Metallococcus carri]NHN54649.1 PRC-barrel domain containing protein [Metallococcus carri]NOP36994.1 PRC-barrel domain-containing protein [Calidifontibacter sp. DB2511S]